MSLTRREMILVGATTTVVVGLVSWVIAAPQIAKIRTAHAAVAKLQNERTVLEKLINQRGAMERQIAELRAQLPRFRQDEQVSAQILLQVRRIAEENQLTVSRLEPSAEVPIGDLSEVAIECTWDGTLDSVTRFLYAVQAQGAMLDVRQLSVQPAQNTTQAGRLRGNFKMFYAFMREKAGPKPATNAPPAAAAAAVQTTLPVVRVTNSAPGTATNAAAAPAPSAPAPAPAKAPAAVPSAVRVPNPPGMPKAPAGQ